MTPTRSGRNYSIQSSGFGPRHSSRKSKRQECQPRGEAQMEDVRTSNSSQRLATTFDTLIEIPETEITAIPVVRPESSPTGSNRDIPVLLKELVYGGRAEGVGTSAKSLDRHNELLSSSGKVHGPRKDRRTSGGWKPMSCKGQVQQIKAWLKNQSVLSEDQKKKLAQRKDNSPVEAPQGSTSKNPPQQVPNKEKQTPNSNQEGKQKAKGKAKSKWNNPYPQNCRIPKREDSHGQCVQYGKNSDGIQKQGGGKVEPIISKEVDLLKLVTHFETCNKEI
ncbi:hypothetical protein O181_128934 [Austropuccinia psidii MF-1]|uniref:Uncharacterized protein n=1 Tax=Austropuccinia psidii MF-1 TaxID=1389203 RepID=A0A9Q3Q8M0_9BASI|nr:hypothetical protein [Austropuccinia psidii MF-1]